jgi:hypothetical protein
MRIPRHLKNIRVDALELGRVAGLLNAAGHKMADGKPYRADAGETAIIARQLEYIRTKTTDVVYAESKALKFFPIASDVPDGARTFVVQQWDMAGSAKIISSFADDLPKVSLLAKERSQIVQTVGNAYDYSIEELKASAFSGVPLQAKKATACRMIHERKVDELVAVGDADADLPGALNNANIPLVVPPNGGWATATPEEILEDMYALEWAVWTNSMELFPPTDMLMSTAEFKRVSTTMYAAGGVTTTETILAVFLKNSRFIKNVEPWHKLDLADAGGTGPRLMAYHKSDAVIEIVLPRPFTQEPPQARNLSWVTNCHSTIGGVQVNYPIGAAYMDGVND